MRRPSIIMRGSVCVCFSFVSGKLGPFMLGDSLTRELQNTQKFLRFYRLFDPSQNEDRFVTLERESHPKHVAMVAACFQSIDLITTLGTRLNGIHRTSE